jgi:hypothetical protein
MSLKNRFFTLSRVYVLSGLLFSIASLALAATGPVSPVKLMSDTGSHLWIKGDSTLHPWASTATMITVEMMVAPSPDIIGSA